MVKIRILKALDRSLGRGIAGLFPAAVPGHLHAVRRILVLRPGGIGDPVLLVPTLEKLAAIFPRAVIEVLAEKRNAAVFALAPSVSRVLRYDQPSEFASVLRGGYDLVIDTEQSHHLSAVVARLAGGRRCIGYATNGRGKLFTDSVSYRHDQLETESFLRLLTPLVKEGDARSLPARWLAAPPSARAAVSHLLAVLGESPFVAIFPGASIRERRWGCERFADLVSRLRRTGIRAVVVGGAVDAAEGRRIAAAGALNLAGKTSLVETAAVLERATLLVSGDSGVLHIGVALGIPTVSLFGPGIQEKWGPRGDNHIVINKRLPCSPCTRFGDTPRCPIAAKC
ncbi:MAG TPA: glycosyltransferase family 9 protein, partial [Verrucomicrobiae bacterium]|nr:glycosyltransferase family 9 protein [Verrucomicrobiae bacterium]